MELVFAYFGKTTGLKYKGILLYDSLRQEILRFILKLNEYLGSGKLLFSKAS